MRGNKLTQWKKKLFECKNIKHAGKIIPLHEMLGITEQELLEKRNAKKNRK